MTDKRRRLLVIGSTGFIGSNLASAASVQFAVSGSDGTDITNRESVRSVFERNRPNTVVLLAAVSDIDRCEREPELAQRVNVQGALNVARECSRTGAHLIYTSSGAVFDGEKNGYRETDAINPVSVYGRTKAEAEAALARILPDATILRLPLVLGYARGGHTNSLVNKLRDAFRAGRTVRAVVTEFRNAIDILSLNQFLLKLAYMRDCPGIFHAGSDRALSRFEITRALAENMGFDPALVEPETSSPPDRAPRGLSHFLISEKLSVATGIPIPEWAAVLERCLCETA